MVFVIVGAPGCGVCGQVKNYLEGKGKKFTYLDLYEMDTEDQMYYQKVANQTFRSVPQTFVNVEGNMMYLGAGLPCVQDYVATLG